MLLRTRVPQRTVYKYYKGVILEYLFEYLTFLGKAVTVVVAFVAVLIAITAAVVRQRHVDDERLEIKPLNDRYDRLKAAVEQQLLPAAVLKERHKAERKKEKLKAKQKEPENRKRVFVLDFDGDIRASEVQQLREEVTAILQVATPEDEVVVKLESPGGMVHGYGLAASQLARIRTAGIPLTAVVDKVAASGGYMMACVADKIVAAPFAIIGSIGVVAQLPNFNKLLKKNDIDYEVLTAGEYKRTLTVFGENTPEGRQKFKAELEETHELFKDFISQYRQQVDVSKVATGEHWYGQQAVDLQLVDELLTSDDYLLQASKECDLLQLKFHGKKPFVEKLMGVGSQLWERLNHYR